MAAKKARDLVPLKEKRGGTTIIEAMSMDLTPAQQVLRDAVPAVFAEHATHVALALSLRADDAAKALAYAQELKIEGAPDAERAAEVLKKASKDAKETDDTRKSFTDPINKAVTTFNGLFSKPKEKFEAAVKILKEKLGDWQRAEQARLNREAEEKRAAAEQEALRLAAASVELGDEQGAVQIMQDLQELPMEAPRAQVTGTYGASFGVAKRKVGTVTDRLGFLEWLITAGRFGDGLALDIVESLGFNQNHLNSLAKRVIENKQPALPGFTAEEVDSGRIR